MRDSGTVGTVASREPSGWSKDAIAFARARQLSLQTLERLGVAEGTAAFASGKHKALFFPHTRHGEVIGWKARSVDGKEFTSKKGGEFRFWNIENALGADTVYITEGEIDACSLVEAGISHKQVVSCPNGAKEIAAEDLEHSYAYAFSALDEGLSEASRFVLCTDNDGPGRVLREDLVRVFGAARCWFIDWPDGCKDANEALCKFGADALREVLEHCMQPWPVSGLMTIGQVPEPPVLQLWGPGFPEWEDKIRLAPRTLSVVTGHPGHGKSTLWMQIWANVAKQHGVRVAFAAFETPVKPFAQNLIRRTYGGTAADGFIQEQFRWIVKDDDLPSLDWLLDVAEVAVIRENCRVIQIDPWNRLESSKPRDMSETEHIAHCLRRMHRFARDMNCHVQVIAHPAKMGDQRRGKAPLLEDISGSKAWDSMCDQGFVVHRRQMWDEANSRQITDAEMYVRKVRFSPDLGWPCTLAMKLNTETRLFESADYDES